MRFYIKGIKDKIRKVTCGKILFYMDWVYGIPTTIQNDLSEV